MDQSFDRITNVNMNLSGHLMVSFTIQNIVIKCKRPKKCEERWPANILKLDEYSDQKRHKHTKCERAWHQQKIYSFF